MILSFSDDERDIYNGILEVISNSKSLEWCNTFQDTEIQVGELRISLAQRSILVNDIEVRLTNTEFEILYWLASNPGRVFAIEQIYNIVFCKVFNEQIQEHGMTKQAVTETIRICKDRNTLKQYLSSKEVEVVTIMMN